MYFLENLNNIIKNQPDKIAVRSSNCAKGITYKKFGEYTGRIYNYLKINNIGKEDMVLICLPRGARVITAMYGVWKAGAAFVIAENTYSSNRLQYIKDDTKAKMVIDEEVYAQMMQCEALDGFESVDEHDACFAIYTSGSTGNPKGILHEYGKINEVMEGKTPVGIGLDERFSLIAPLNFVAAIFFIINIISSGRELHVIPYEIIKNTPLFIEYIEENNITSTFATPSYIKTLSYIPKTINRIYVAGELASNLYSEDKLIYNLYSSSETVFLITGFSIDKKYANTPVGKACTSNKVFVVDENGSPLPKGEKGEVCVENKYTRGYINLSEKTSEVFVNGIYHMGDMGYFDENDNLVICGRIDDMIKINGNRIEPAEIENALRKVLEINNCIAKGFFEETRSYIAAYALKNELDSRGLLSKNGKPNIDFDKMRIELAIFLPYYMIPTYFEVLDSFPQNSNGKVVRRELPKPIINCYEDNYAAPEGEEETYFCKLFAKILGHERVSALGDFYQLGGDSIRAMEFVAQSKYRELSISDLYQARTPRRLVQKLQEKMAMDHGDINKRNQKSLEHTQPLLKEALQMLEVQLLLAKDTLWNLSLFYELKENVNVRRLKEAIDRVLSAHPVFSTHFIFDEDCNLMMKYDPGFYQETEIIRTSEQKFQAEKDGYSEYYILIDRPLYKNRIYVTEKSAYIFLNFHHTIMDGTSLKILKDQISRAYEEDSFVPEPDYFYLIARNAAKMSFTKGYREIGQRYIDELDSVLEKDKTKPVSFLKYDQNDFEIHGEEITRTFGISKKALSKDSAYYKYGGNTMFLYAFLKTQAQFNENECAYTYWVYNGRDEAISMNAMGMLLRVYPAYMDFSNIKSDTEGMERLKERVYSDISAGYRDFTYEAGDKLFNITDFIYQKDLLVDPWEKNLTKKAVGANWSDEVDGPFEIMIIDNAESDTIDAKIGYMNGLYKRESMERFLDLLMENVRKLF